MTSPDDHKHTPVLPAELKIPFHWQDYALPALLFTAFLVTAAVITVTDTASAYGGYLAILFVGMTYPLPWYRISYVAAALSSVVMIYWYNDSWMTWADALAGLVVSLIVVWAIAFAVAHIQRLESQVDTQDKQLDIALTASDLGIFHWDLKTNRVYAHGKLRELWGIQDDGPIYSRDIVRRVHEDDVAEVTKSMEVALAGGGDYNAEFRVRDPKSGQVRWLMGRGKVIQAIRGRRLYLTGTNLDITDLKEEELRIRSILNGLGVIAGLLTPDGKLIEANSLALETADLTPDDVVGKPFWETYWWSHDRIEQSRLQQAVSRAAEGETVKYDAVLRRAEGDFATVAFFLSPVFNARGEIIYLVPSAVDISERKQAEEQVNLLVQELNHRIKNLFSVTNALINLSARHATDVNSFVQSTLKRLQALHASHAMTGADVTNPQSFYSTVDAAALAAKVLAPFRGEHGDRFEINGNEMRLDPGEATAFSLILNELAANSVKHGALTAEGGRLVIEWTPLEGDGNYDFRWCEEGGPPVSNVDGKGFGHSIITLLTRNYLDGECSFEAAETGYQFRIAVRAEDDDDTVAAE